MRRGQEGSNTGELVLLSLCVRYCHYMWDIVVTMYGILSLCVGYCCYYVWDIVVSMCGILSLCVGC